jgi:hypothetical protein
MTIGCEMEDSTDRSLDITINLKHKSKDWLKEQDQKASSRS